MMAVGPDALKARQVPHHLNSAEITVIQVLPQLSCCCCMRAAKVGGVELSTSSKFTEVKSPTMSNSIADAGADG